MTICDSAAVAETIKLIVRIAAVSVAVIRFFHVIYTVSSLFSVACGVFGKQHTILKRGPKVDRKS